MDSGALENYYALVNLEVVIINMLFLNLLVSSCQGELLIWQAMFLFSVTKVSKMTELRNGRGEGLNPWKPPLLCYNFTIYRPNTRVCTM